MQVHDAVLTTTGCGSRHQPVAPQQNILVTSMPGAQGQHVLGAVFHRKHDAGKALIGGRLHKLIRFGRADDGDLIAQATSCASHVQEHDFTAAHITVISSDVELFVHLSTPSPAYVRERNSYRST